MNWWGHIVCIILIKPRLLEQGAGKKNEQTGWTPWTARRVYHVHHQKQDTARRPLHSTITTFNNTSMSSLEVTMCKLTIMSSSNAWTWNKAGRGGYYDCSTSRRGEGKLNVYESMHTTLLSLFISFILIAELSFQLRHVLMVLPIRDRPVISINAIADKRRDVTPAMLAAHWQLPLQF